MQPTDEAAAGSAGTVQHEGFVAEVRERGAPLDALALALVPLALVGAYALPPSTKRSLAFAYADPTLLAAFANHFVHLSFDHLLVNLVGYGLVVPTAYLLSVASGRRRQFFVAFVTFVLAFPFALSALNLAFVRPRVGVGASALVMAFVGYLPVALSGFAGSRLGVPVDTTRSSGPFFLGLAVVAYVAAPADYGAPLAVAAGLAGVLFLLPVVEDAATAVSRPTVGPAGYAEVAVLGAALFVGYPLVAFPESVAAGGDVVNVYSHALGFCLGYIVTYVGVLVGALE